MSKRLGGALLAVAALGLMAGGALAGETRITAPAGSSCEYAAQKAFEAAREDDFGALEKIMHPEAVDGGNRRQSLRRYSWKQLVKRVGAICDPSTAAACHYVVTRVQDVRQEQKVFVKKHMQGPSMPCPMTCKRVPAAAGAEGPWRLLRIGCI